MSQELMLLMGSAAALGAVHTVLGPDHYLPFIVLSKARQWSLRKTMWITGLCGLGHIASSVILGLVGIALGVAARHLELIETRRGEIAAWLIVGFGLAYFVWGTVRALRNRPHAHAHAHADGIVHRHAHTHHAEHLHPHEAGSANLTPWILFTIFVFGPCEPLIPLLMYPAMALHPWAVALVAGVFGTVTIATMLGVVFVSSYGLRFLRIERLAPWSHSIAGATIFFCGVAIFLGL